MEKPQAQELYTLKLMVGDLNTEVARLQMVIGRMHTSDLNSLKRAYNSMVQHCGALELESRTLEGDIRALATELITPEDVSHGLWSVGAVTTGLYALQRVLRLLSPHARQVPRMFWLFGAAYLGIQFLQGALARLHALVAENRQRKAHLLKEWRLLRERVEIMNALTNWASTTPATLDGPIIEHSSPTSLVDEASSATGSPQSRSAAAAAMIEQEVGRILPATV